MPKCLKCQKYGLRFQRNYRPDEFLEGHPTSKVWIVGINPAESEDWTDPGQNAAGLKNRFDGTTPVTKYFTDFKRVSERLYNALGKEYGVAHTDLVKCSSRKWPPQNTSGKVANDIVSNCQTYLFEQIREFRPKMIICNGANPSHSIKLCLPPVDDHGTYYRAKIEGCSVFVVLTGFVGRLDNYSRKRLGHQIENLLDSEILLSDRLTPFVV